MFKVIQPQTKLAILIQKNFASLLENLLLLSNADILLKQKTKFQKKIIYFKLKLISYYLISIKLIK